MRVVRLKTLLIGLSLLAVSMGTAAVQAQDAGPESPIRLQVSNYDAALPVEQTFLDALAGEMAANGLAVVYVGMDESTPSPGSSVVTVEFDPHYFGDHITLYQNAEPLRRVSPILHSRLLDGFGVTTTGDSGQSVTIAAAVVLLSAGRCDLAAPYLDRLGDLNAGNFSTAFFRGNCALVDSSYQEAVDLYQSVLFDVRGVPVLSVVTNSAWAYLQLGRDDTAIQLMTLAVSYNWSFPSTKATALEDRAQLYALSFDYDSAIADVDAALEAYSQTPAHSFSASRVAELYTLRGQMVLLTYEWDTVLRDYNTAIDTDPEYAPAYFFRGVLYYTEGPREKALPDFQRYLELEPDGEYADEASRYVDSIRTELEALGTTQP